ncbi:MAG: hypothetical protein COU08_00780 [Candidatus Harrisonbacteria bacterium CG10_big_fil_rev_8_21_14_0_10_42_17]|uniref:Uncharacterized protein n=1 Tax=Candidatus Harrisonbacteria bacterium CG10_big_fil_rev_8_21_14_0_10_42_17 TaxID=1974584 RepID=A0A2M6WIZ6_9BACT|nr:MAG: hypothetical protein COU08_00780 [Candidatus Harrisonbacteria bacterium CG10_big_fil_rev_8_21_14_0_10_42_17]
MTTMTIRKKKQAERSCERWPVGCGCSSRQFSVQDFLPRVHLKEFAVKEKLEIVASLCETKTAKEPVKTSARTIFCRIGNFFLPRKLRTIWSPSGAFRAAMS